MQALMEQLAGQGTPLAFLPAALFSSLSETDSPQGVLLLMERRERIPLAALSTYRTSAEPPLYIALDRVQDPGNVGTILRTADAVGAAGVILLRGSADIYSGKVVRATMGSLFHVPFAEGVAPADLMAFAHAEGFCLYAAACDDAACTHFDADLRGPLLVVFGNEANGVSKEILDGAAHLYIPMRGHAESLNVSAAAAAVLYEAMRQRFFGKKT